jgi:F-box protein 21
MAEVVDGGNVVSLLHLADELLEMIFCCPQLDHRDLAALAGVCSRFWALSCSREVWKNKALERWQVWSFDIADIAVDWKAAYRERLFWQKLVYPPIRELSVLNFSKHNVSYDTMSQIDVILKEKSSVPAGLSDALDEILGNKDSTHHLTMKYYARHVKEYVKFFQLEKELQALFELSSDEIELEKGAILLSQWQQSPLRVSADSVYAQLDSMATRVKELLTKSSVSQSHCNSNEQTPALEERHTTYDHAAKVLRQSGDSQSANRSITSAIDCGHQFNADLVLRTLNKVMFEEWQFVGNTRDYYNPNNSYIDEVLKNRTGMPITMCIVYVAVARRLGVKVEPDIP